MIFERPINAKDLIYHLKCIYLWLIKSPAEAKRVASTLPRFNQNRLRPTTAHSPAEWGELYRMHDAATLHRTDSLQKAHVLANMRWHEMNIESRFAFVEV
ncbi:hypothetical protein O3G_MSEX005713 [Manduca sexta]|uniref:Uncharacterized protein n=1 Tax=Manduca sexta TaxID=7130 RepID=A0A921Z268_MANSE|nr:hypothetical protein O3G_MSEX005713 [Manduca sexta]